VRDTVPVCVIVLEGDCDPVPVCVNVLEADPDGVREPVTDDDTDKTTSVDGVAVTV